MEAKAIIEKYLDKSVYDLCCSESIIYAANEYYNLGVSQDVIKASGAFCGGSYVEGKCGIIQSANMIIAIMFYENCAHKSERMKELILQYNVEYKEMFSSDNCERLKELYRKEDIGCKELIVLAFIELTKFIDKNR